MPGFLPTDPSQPLRGVRALFAAHDWRSCPLGHPDTWPAELATAVRMALNSSFPMFVAWGPDLRFFYNDAYAVILGAKHPAALAQPFREIWAEIWSELVPIIDQALSNKSAFHEDLPLTVVRQGFPEQGYFTFSYSPLHDGTGAVAGMYCTVIETTSRVQSERRAAIELRLSNALRPLGSPDEVLATASALLAEELGLSRVTYAEVDDAGRAFTVRHQWNAGGAQELSRQVYPLDGFGPTIAALTRAGETLVAGDIDSDPRFVDCRTIFRAEGAAAVLTVPLMRGGRLAGFLSLNRAAPYHWLDADVRFTRETAERTWGALETARAQAELRAERDRSRYIFDTIGEGFGLADRNWTMLEMNAEGLRICRLTADQVIGRSHWELFPEVEGTEAGAMLHRAMNERVAGTVEHPLNPIDGREGWNEIRAYPTQDGGVAIFFREITDRKRAEEKLREADQRKDEFLAMLAHELRNPLAPISAAAMLLDMGSLNETRVRQSSAIIGRQVRHMTRLVDDLLDVSRVTRGLIELERVPLDVRGIVDEAIEQVRPQLAARRQRLALHYPSVPLVVEGDRARLVQVMSNLLGNAVKYTPEDRAIEVGAQAVDGKLVLVVRDEGIGMERELTERAFDLFTQAKRSSDRSQGGLGLGLALVRNLVELHGGTVTCASPGLGLGSTFTVTLPLASVLAPGAAQPIGEARPADGLRLLVVDDNVDAATTLALLLETAGHEVFIEHESLRALELARGARLDACLLDIGLPDIDGNELARRLRAQPETAHCILIAVSGYGQEQDRRTALAAGFNHHLVKPVEIEALDALLAQVRRGGASERRRA
ncbi:ATP-binding protein [Massilia sp. Leaf139]|uniref:hybrid sensor histidine kinase/response regulator n=1 Tax=Massilia sp. Leaf139 TaxID=1736272 RepID=UPI0006FA27C1|nr:ATP-binding protein [Massilia sp. Leaf139]KQQ89297.1 diguanylate cyclase [Massilia sp. Leaf139]